MFAPRLHDVSDGRPRGKVVAPQISAWLSRIPPSHISQGNFAMGCLGFGITLRPRCTDEGGGRGCCLGSPTAPAALTGSTTKLAGTHPACLGHFSLHACDSSDGQSLPPESWSTYCVYCNPYRLPCYCSVQSTPYGEP